MRGTEHKAAIYESSLLSFYVIPLRPEYLSQHPILEHLQLFFLLQCVRPSFTPIHSDRQNYSSVYLNLHFPYEERKTD